MSATTTPNNNSDQKNPSSPVPVSTAVPAHESPKDPSARDPPPPSSPPASSPPPSSSSSSSSESEHTAAPPDALSPGPGPEPEPEAEAEAEAADPREELEAFDWEDLEARFGAKMEECKREEERVGEEFRGWSELFKVWSSTTLVHEGERARKRLRTRIASVQNAEQQFEEKRQHYIKVVQAFESALALLGGL